MKQRIDKKKGLYEGFTLVEMLVTVVIISFVFSLVATTLTTLVKISNISTSKTTARNESEFILELIRKNVRNSNVGDVLIFEISGREYDGESVVETGEVIGYEDSLGAGEEGNEIHLRPNGYSKWVCIGYFPSTEEGEPGYILKSSSDDISSDHSTCFDPESEDYEKYTIELNSEEINILSFAVKYIESTYENYLILADISVEPVYWYEGAGAFFSKEINRQVVVSTEGLTW